MKNKNLFVKLGLVTAIFGCAWMSFTSALNLNLKMWQGQLSNWELLMIEKNIMPIHFADNWNDFGWLFYFSNGSWENIINTEDEEVIEYVTVWSDTYWCKKQIKWWYYNAERWERLWPLDNDTKNAWWLQDLQMDWWIYTRCATEWFDAARAECVSGALNQGINYNDCIEEIRKIYKWDEYGYYGSLKHGFSWQQLIFVEWVNYYSDNNNANHDFINVNKNNKELASTFIRFWNKFPVWFIYDTNGWVGFVWCRITDHKRASLKKIIGQLAWSDIRWKDSNWVDYNTTPKKRLEELFAFSWTDGIKYTWIWSDGVTCDVVSMADTMIWVVIEWIVWMGTNAERWVAFNESDEKMQYFSSASVDTNSLMNYAKQKAEQMCRGKWTCDASDSLVCCETAPSSIVKSTPTQRKTYVIKNWNVTIHPETSSDGTSYYDVFLYSGNLIVDEASNLFVFKTWWFVSSTSVNSFNDYVEEIRNGTDGLAYYVWEDAVVAWLLKWIFIVNGHIYGVGGPLEHKYFLYGKFSSKDSFNDLLETFSWRCTAWAGSDGNACPQSYSINTSSWWKSWQNPYANASLIVIDQNYYSPFFNA